MAQEIQAPHQPVAITLPEGQDRNDSLKSIVRLGDILKYEFAYPVIYLRPSDPARALALQQRFSSQNYVAVNIDLSDEAPTTIELNCDTLLLVGGECYKGHSKNVTLRCRRLMFQEGLGEASKQTKQVTFDLSGFNSAALTADPVEHATDANPSSRTAQRGTMNVEKKVEYYSAGEGGVYADEYHLVLYNPAGGAIVPAQAGVDANEIAKPGKQGRDGGCFRLYASQIDATMIRPEAPPICVLANGSDGGPGQDGGNGTKGGRGVDWPCEIQVIRFSDDQSLKVAYDLYEGGAGGKGGYGGPGGRGGSSGSVFITCGENLNISTGLVVLENAVGKDGAEGKDGNPGDKGDDSNSGFFKPYEGWARLAYILPDDDPYKAKIDGLHSGIKHTANTPNLTTIDVAQRWQKVSEAERRNPPTTGTLNTPVSDAHAEVYRVFGEHPLLLMMFIQRLHFEHFVYFTSQAYPDPNSKELAWLRQGRNDFQLLYKWLEDLIASWQTQVGAGPSALPVLQQEVHNQFGLLSCKVCAAPVMDPFKHSIKYVPWIPSKAVYKSIRDDFRTAESSFKSIADVLEAKQKDRQAAAGNLNQASQKIQACVSQIKQDEKTLKDIEGQFVFAQKDLDDYLDKMKQDLEQLKEALRHHVECSGEQICEAASSVLMFGSGETASVAGSALSIGTAAYRVRDEAVNTIGGVQKKLLYGKLDFMSETESELQKDIGKSLQDMRQSGTGSNEYRQQIVANKYAFDNLCSEVLNKIKASKNVRDRYRQILKTMDRRDKAVADYNRAFISIAEQRIVIEGQEKSIETIKSASSNLLSDDEVQIVAQFSARIHSDIAQFALWAVWGRARAYNCASFRTSRIYSFMSNLSLHSFSSLTVEILDQLDTIMNEDLVLQSEEWSRNRKNRTTVVFSLTDENCAFLLASLRDSQDGSFELDIDHDFFYEYSDFQDNEAYDFRLYSMAVYLHGARNKKQLSNENLKAAVDDITVHIYNHGQNRYRYPAPKSATTQAWLEEMFEFGSTSHPFQYKYDVDKDECTAPPNAYYAAEELELDVDGQPSHEPMRLKSPLSCWTIQAADFIDVTKVHKINIQFEITYRIRNQQKH